MIRCKPLCVAVTLEVWFQHHCACEGPRALSREDWYHHGLAGRRTLAIFGLGPWP